MDDLNTRPGCGGPANNGAKCEKCGCPGVLNTANADGGKASEWTCWGWQCRHKWTTPNALGEGRDAGPIGGASALIDELAGG